MHLPADPPPFSGRCLCDRVKYRVLSLPLIYYACHCTDCQKRTGSAFRLAMVVQRDQLQVTEGLTEVRSFTFKNKRRQARICPHCDTRLWAEPEDRPSIAILLPGTLDRAAEFTPVAHIWVRSAVQWFKAPEGTISFETQPTDPLELVRLWPKVTANASSAA